MLKLTAVSSAFFGFVATVLLAGCGTTATVSRLGSRPLDARIVGGDSASIYVETDSAKYAVPRNEITDIDHPGNVAATIGAIVTGYGIANIAAGASDCDRYGGAYCAGVFLPAAIGAPVMAYGLVTWISSVSAAGERKKSDDRSFAVVPVVSTDKKNEYVGVSAAMRF